LAGGANGCILYSCSLSNNSAQYGGGAVACTLYNCTLVGNEATAYWGGAAYVCTLYNCTLAGNSAYWGGGGADGGTLHNCTLKGNSTTYGGGGADGGTLYNCTLVGNSGVSVGSGGAHGCTLYNCIVCFNTEFSAPPSDANYDSSSILNYSCTTPRPTNGVANIINEPMFVNTNGWSNLRLQSNSPCINSGDNAYAAAATDLDGNPRIVSGTVDIGAYEYQGTGSRISYAWLQHYGLPNDGSADFIDSDHDGMNNWQEWVCGTDPTDPQSALRMISATPSPTNVTVTWQSVAGANYFLQRSGDLRSPFTLLATSITGQASTTSYTDTSITGRGPFFYRVGVNSP
jgi:hypothetical protein